MSDSYEPQSGESHEARTRRVQGANAVSDSYEPQSGESQEARSADSDEARERRVRSAATACRPGTSG